MKTYLLATFFLVLPKAFADFDRPLFKNAQMLEYSEVVEDEKVKLNCYVYKKYVVLEKEEPGFIGKTIYYKEINTEKKVSSESFCKDIKQDSFKKLPSSGSSFYGMFRRYLFVQDPDELSARTRFEAYNLNSGVMTYTGIKNNNTMVKIIPISAKTVALEYYQRYSPECEFNSEQMRLKCWSEFLKSVEVPEKVKIPYPDCPKTKNNKKYQVFLKVQVPDIQKSKRTFLWSKPICEVAP